MELAAYTISFSCISTFLSFALYEIDARHPSRFVSSLAFVFFVMGILVALPFSALLQSLSTRSFTENEQRIRSTMSLLKRFYTSDTYIRKYHADVVFSPYYKERIDPEYQEYFNRTLNTSNPQEEEYDFVYRRTNSELSEILGPYYSDRTSL